MATKYRRIIKVLLVLVTIVASFGAYFGFQRYEQEEAQEDRYFASRMHDEIRRWQRSNQKYPLSLVECDPKYFPLEKREQMLAKWRYCVSEDRQSYAFGYIHKGRRYQWNFRKGEWDEFDLKTTNLPSCAELATNHWSSVLIDPFK